MREPRGKAAGRPARAAPLPAVLALCATCFCAGLLAHRLPALGRGAPSRSTFLEHPLDLQQQLVAATAPAASVAGPAPGEPHDAAVERCLAAAGLLPPPLTPAASGSARHATFPYQVLSLFPRMVVFPGFVTPEQARHVVGLAARRVQRSDVKIRDGVGEDAQQQRSARTSSGAFLAREDDPEGVLALLEGRIEAATLIPASHGESFYALRYEQGQKYDSHLDVFTPEEYGAQRTMRMATVIVVLQEPREGGETVFKMEGEHGDKREVSNITSCDPSKEFTYQPRAGDALLFYSLTHDGAVDYRSLHGGCPVRSGTKWVLTKWLHNKPLKHNTGGFGWN